MAPPLMFRAPQLETERLLVRMATVEDVPAILEFFAGNRDHLRPFEPVKPPDFYTAAHWEKAVIRSQREFRAGLSARTFLFAGPAPGHVVGTANITQIIRGVFHSCFLGYSLARAEEGRGLMSEALRSLIAYSFEELRLHRISANYMPHNVRSGRLLRRLGFVVEGYARDYLQIDGQWEDHILTALYNPDWRPPEPPSEPEPHDEPGSGE